MKTISVVVACYNEEENIKPLIATLQELFKTKLPQYDYEILCIDNDSKDRTREYIREMCEQDSHVRAIFNTHNFGSIRSSTYGLLSATGDCVVKMCADFQDPPELILDFVREYENGHKIVLGIKRGTSERRFMSGVRRLFYRIMKKITTIEHIDNFIGYGLYDRDFIEILRSLDDPMPYFRGIIAELGYKYQPVYYDQPPRKYGKSKFNFYRYYDYTMVGLTSYSKMPMRICVLLGMVIAFFSFLIAMFYLVVKLVYWDKIAVGMAPVVVGIFFIGAVQMIFLGVLGEYIMSINIRLLKRPLVTVEETINI